MRGPEQKGEVERLLDEVAAAEAEALRAARVLERAPGLDSVERTLASQWGGGPRRRRRRALVAAAAVFLAFLTLLSVQRSLVPTAAPETFLLGSALAPLSPLEVARYDELRWRGPVGVTYIVRVSAGGTVAEAPLLGPVECRVPRLEFPPRARQWPNTVFVEIAAVAPDGSRLGSARWRLSRSAR